MGTTGASSAAHRVRLLVVGLVGVVVLVGAAAASGFISLPGSEATSRPACDALPTQTEVAAALRDHPEVTSGLEAAAEGTGEDVEVAVGRPCSGTFADRALVTVSAPGDAADAVQRWLGSHDGYGVPIQVTD